MTHSSKYGHVQSWGFLPDRWACFQPWIILTYQWILYLIFIIFKINQVALKHWQKDWQNNNKKNGCTMYNLSNGHLSKVPILEGFPLRHTRLILVLNNLASVFRWFFVQNMGHGIGAFQYFLGAGYLSRDGCVEPFHGLCFECGFAPEKAKQS